MAAPLLDPQLQAFYEANPGILRPERLPSAPRRPRYETSAIELAAAFLITRTLVSAYLAHRKPDPKDTQVVAGQAWNHHAPVWMRFAVPAIKQAYSAGMVRDLSEDELNAMAEDYARTLGEYVNQSSAEALSSGFNAQLQDRWSESLAWERVSAGYGLDKPDMRTYIRTVSSQKPGQRDAVGTAGRMLVDRLLLNRADAVGANEAWTAGQTGQAIAWMMLQARGELPADAEREWDTANDESVCPVCGPMNGQRVLLGDMFLTPEGNKLLAPTAHPGCRCMMKLVRYPLAKNLGDDPYDRDPKGRFADREYRTRTVTSRVLDRDHVDPAVQHILDDLAEVTHVNPFGVDTAPARANPFAPSSAFGGNPFADTGNAFGVTKNPFAAVEASSGAFDDTKHAVQRAAAGPRRYIVHLFNMPKKRTPAERASHQFSERSHYLDVNDIGAYFDTNFDGDVAVGNLDFNEITEFYNDEDYRPPGGPEEGTSIVASVHESPWAAVQPQVEGISGREWHSILRQAKPVWDAALEPDKAKSVLEQLQGYELQQIATSAGISSYRPANDLRAEIYDSVINEHLSDPSAREAFADYVTWHRPELVGSNGEELERTLTASPWQDEFMEGRPSQVFNFHQGFHFDNPLLQGQYVQTDMVYRSVMADYGPDHAPLGHLSMQEYMLEPSAEASGYSMYEPGDDRPDRSY